ncbi:MAG: DUF1501 domain-containing protein [Bacteroidota bacterium]
MKRRDFIRNTTAAGTIPLLLGGGMPMRTMGASFKSAATCDYADRSIVIIYLNGANDVYNAFVGLDNYGAYRNARPNIGHNQNQLMTLDSSLPNNQQLGLHPILTGMRDLYDSDKFSIVQRVGYPRANYSHFDSEDYMFRGRDGEGMGMVPPGTGFMGRFTANRYPGYQGIPFEGEPDPLGLILSNLPSTGFHTQEEHNIELRIDGNPGQYADLISSVFGEPLTNIPGTENGTKLNYINNINVAANLYASRISDTYNLGSNSNVNYPSSSLGNDLEIIAKMLSGGSRTKIFLTSTGGWDNHNEQVNNGNTTQGRHSDLLGNLSNSVKAFHDDLQNLGLGDNVLTIIFSEFARKAEENGNLGTDHGTLNNIFVVGNGARSGVTGTNYDFTDIDRRGAINQEQREYDYRSVFGSVLQDWMGASDESLAEVFPGISLDNSLSLVDTNSIVDSQCYWVPAVQNIEWTVGAKIFLQGYYDETAGEMRRNLVENNLVPTSQPYTGAPFNYTGSESASTFPTDTVDWVLVELRDASALNTLVATKAVLVRKDGMLMEPSGTVGVTFVNIPSGFYHLAVYHRSHLAVLSATSISTTQASPMLDFTQTVGSAMGTNQQADLNGAFGMHVGDYDSNGICNNQDFNIWKREPAALDAYLTSDGDGNGIINNQDFNRWKGNSSRIGINEIQK